MFRLLSQRAAVFLLATILLISSSALTGCEEMGDEFSTTNVDFGLDDDDSENAPPGDDDDFEITDDDDDESDDDDTNDDDDFYDDDDTNDDDDFNDDDDDYEQLFPGGPGLSQVSDCNHLLSSLRALSIHRMEELIDYQRRGRTPPSDDDDFWVDDDDGWGDDDDDDVVDDDDFVPPDDDDDDDDDDDNRHSETNVQEDGVDEADLVKTDGDYLFIANGGYMLIFDVIDQLTTFETGRVPIEGTMRDMYLWGELAMVFSTVDPYNLSADIWPNIPSRGDLYPVITKITLIDHTDKYLPVVFREVYVEANLLSSRRVAQSVRVVLETVKGGPDVQTTLSHFGYSDEEYQDALDALELLNRAIINGSGLEYWIPRYYDIIQSDLGEIVRDGFLVDCDDHFLPLDAMGTNALSIMIINFEYPAEKLGDITLIADGHQTYGTSDNLYVSGNVSQAYLWDLPTSQTQIHKFDIDTYHDESLYMGSGAVNGYLLDQFCMSEYEGYLRVATTTGGSFPTNRIFVLRQNAFSLDVVGQVSGIGRGERVYAVRFHQDKGYVVTFRRTDPFWTIDLSDHLNPLLVGELQVPGFSTYLHPMDEDYVLAIGEDGDAWGANGGVALAVFDVTNFARPTRAHFIDLGGYGVSSEAKYEHHAFLYYKPDELIAIPFSRDPFGPTAFSGVLAMNVNPISGFQVLSEINHIDFTGEPGSGSYIGYNMGRRSVVIGDYLYTISDLGLMVTDQNNWSNILSLDLPWNM